MVDKENIKIKFDDNFKKIDNSYKNKVKKQINKIIQNPEIGKPMKTNRKGTVKFMYLLLDYLMLFF